jgi:leader peptidase (prepilin peptidase)/N-methyltransferase
VTLIRALVALPFGLVFGSFMTVVAYRVPKGESIVAPRSRCPSCGAAIHPRDNIPVFSWVLLRGRCRGCGTRISVSYPLLELSVAGLCVAAAARFGERPWVAVLTALFLALLPAIGLIDIWHRIIPNRIVLPALPAFGALIAVANLFDGGPRIVPALLGSLAYGGAFLLIAIVSPRGLGMGDVKLVTLLGLVLGSLGFRYVAVGAGVAIALGGVAGIVALVSGRDRKTAIPYGPFLCAGAAASVFLAPQIAGAYLNALT